MMFFENKVWNKIAIKNIRTNIKMVASDNNKINMFNMLTFYNVLKNKTLWKIKIITILICIVRYVIINAKINYCFLLRYHL